MCQVWVMYFWNLFSLYPQHCWAASKCQISVCWPLGIAVVFQNLGTALIPKAQIPTLLVGFLFVCWEGTGRAQAGCEWDLVVSRGGVHIWDPGALTLRQIFTKTHASKSEHKRNHGWQSQMEMSSKGRLVPRKQLLKTCSNSSGFGGLFLCASLPSWRSSTSLFDMVLLGLSDLRHRKIGKMKYLKYTISTYEELRKLHCFSRSSPIPIYHLLNISSAHCLFCKPDCLAKDLLGNTPDKSLNLMQV